MKKISSHKLSLQKLSAVTVAIAVIIGTELFHFINSIKLNLIMPTISNVLHEDTVRSWQISNGTICIHYGKFLWDALSVAVYLIIMYVLWRLVVKRILK